MIPPRADVVIAGAGPAGSATAWHLARAGFQVVVVDRAAFPRDKPCSEYMSPETVRLLDAMGVVGALEQAGACPLFGIRLRGSEGSALTARFAAAPVRPFREAGLSVARRLLDATLVDAARAAGAIVAERLSVEQLLYDDGAVSGVLVRTSTGGCLPIQARLVVGADGLRSVVARRLGGRRHGLLRRLALVAHVAGVPALDGLAELHLSRRGYVGLNRISRDLANVALVIPRGKAEFAAARGALSDFFHAQLERFPGVRGRVDSAKVIRPVLVTGPFAVWSRRIIADGALLVGDAADFFDPFTGEGIYSALKGAELAAAAAAVALDSGGTRPVPANRLAPYLAARRRAFFGKWIIERMVGYGMGLPRLFDRAIARLERRGLADTFIGVTGDFVPPRAVLDPRFLARMVL